MLKDPHLCVAGEERCRSVQKCAEVYFCGPVRRHWQGKCMSHKNFKPFYFVMSKGM